MDEVYNLETSPLIPTPFAGENYLSAENSSATTILHFAFCILHFKKAFSLFSPPLLQFFTSHIKISLYYCVGVFL